MLYINSLLLAVFSMSSLALYNALIPVASTTVERPLIEISRADVEDTPTIVRHVFENDAAQHRIAARPLFSPSRRPADTAPAMPQAPVQLPSVALNGVSMVGGERRALVTIGEQTVQTVGEGDVLDGWTVARIMPREIDIQRGAVTHTFAMGMPDDTGRPEPLAVRPAPPVPAAAPVTQPSVDMTDALD